MRYFIINIIIQCLLTATSLAIITYYIEKHSVHPIYGEYPQKAFGCEPWDSCKKKKIIYEEKILLFFSYSTRKRKYTKIKS